MEENWVVICLGNEPLAFGPYGSELEADENLERHAPLVKNGNSFIDYCLNGIAADEHHVLKMEK